MLVNEIDKTKITRDDYLVVQNLKTQFFTSKGIVKAIDSVSFSVKEGEVYGIVGESGCGKSVTATSVMDLVPDPPGRIIGGSIYVDGFDIISDTDKLVKITVKSETDVKIKRNKRLIKRHNYIISRIRGKKIAMIFQEPSLALNPVMTIGDQIIENILLHNMASISESIIRRETIKDRDLDNFLSEASGIKDHSDLKRFVQRWARDFGMPDIEDSILNVLSSNAAEPFVRKELVELIIPQRKGVSINIFQETKDYHDDLNKLLDLNLKLLNSENKADTVGIARYEQEVKNLERQMRTKYLVFNLKRNILKKTYQRVFQEEARRRAIELLKLVNIAGPERVIDSYPHELSGGMQQRSMIAMALASDPRLLIADEPTTALDVTTQAQILDLIRELNKFTGSSVIFITHDLAVIAEMCNRVAVMYAGNIVEEASVDDIFTNSKHPYTTGLLKSIPRTDVNVSRNLRMESIPGNVPNLITPPTGCRFNPRCQHKMDVCEKSKRKLVDVGDGHKVACFLYSDLTDGDN